MEKFEIPSYSEAWISAASREYSSQFGEDFDEDKREKRLRVYCDATPSRREIVGLTEAGHSGKPMARLCVVVPDHDVVIISKFEHQRFFENEEANTSQLEYLGIQRAIEYCHSKGISQFSTYNDNQGSVRQAAAEINLGSGGRVRWLQRDFTPAGIILDRITHRSKYLSKTKGKVAYRRPNAEHEEILRLMQAEDIQCTLSGLQFWETILKRKLRDYTW